MLRAHGIVQGIQLRSAVLSETGSYRGGAQLLAGHDAGALRSAQDTAQLPERRKADLSVEAFPVQAETGLERIAAVSCRFEHSTFQQRLIAAGPDADLRRPATDGAASHGSWHLSSTRIRRRRLPSRASTCARCGDRRPGSLHYPTRDGCPLRLCAGMIRRRQMLDREVTCTDSSNQ